MLKYDSFWKTTISESSFRSAIETAAKGATGRVALGSIWKCSPNKKDWYGIVRVRHGGIERVGSGDPAAHATSLGRVLVNDGILGAWPAVVFRFTIDKAGNWLSVRTDGYVTKAPGGFTPRSAGTAGRQPTSRVRSAAKNATTSDCIDELRSGPSYRFKDWPDVRGSVPDAAGAYTIWRRPDEFLYVGRSDKLRERLNSHWLGNRGNDQFNVYIADRVLLPTFTPERIAQIGAGDLRFDGMIRDYIRINLDFRFSQTTEARAVEERIRAGRWPCGAPTLNPL